MNNYYLFRWLGLNIEGEILQGKIAAPNRIQAKEQLLQQNIYLIRIKKETKVRLSLFERCFMWKQLAALLATGFSLCTGLKLLRQQKKDLTWQYILDEIHQNILHGYSLSEAIIKYPYLFSNLDMHIISTGENTGRLDYCCSLLATQIEKQISLQNTIKKILRYPIIILSLMVIMLFAIIFFVLPQFTALYRELGADLPWITQKFINAAEFIYRNSYLLGFLILLPLFSYHYLRRQYTFIKTYEYWMLTKLPYINQIHLYYCLEKILHTLSLTYASGLDLINGLNYTKNSTDNPFLRIAIDKIQHDVLQGMMLNQAIQKHKIFPPIISQIIQLAEESGNLEDSLNKLTTFYRQETDSLLDQLTSYLEPFLTIIIGTIIGLLILIIYMPILQLNNTLTW